MHLAYTAEQVALQKELRDYFAGIMTPEVEAATAAGETGDPACLEAVRQMGADGWLGVGWPTEFGGRGFGPVEQFIFMNESWRSGAPVPFLSVNTVGPTIMQFGTPEQKAHFLPKILAGELHFSIGYTEPGSGTDLASLTTKAVRDGDEWVINGQKTYTSLASYADYVWLAARTDPDAAKHRGITIFAVPATDPGYSYSKISTMVNASTFHTFYDDVRVPDSAIIGGLDRGWDLIVNQLNYERVSLSPPGMVEGVFEAVIDWAKETPLPGGGGGGRPGVGAGEPGPGPRRARLPAPHQLEGRRPRRRRPVAEPGRRQRHQGVRHRVLHRRLPAADGGARGPGHPAPGEPRGLPRRPAGAGLPGHADPHLRGRDQRDPARPHRHVRPRHAPHPPDVRDDPVDLTLTDDQTAIVELAARILGDRCPPEHLAEVEAGGDRFDPGLWTLLAEADLLGLCLPEADGGGGYGVLEAALLAQEVGRTAAPVPLWSTLFLGALPLARHGTEAQRADLLPAVASGRLVLTAALVEEGGSLPPAEPATTATADGDGWRLEGTKHVVPSVHLAASPADLDVRVLVPARTPDGTAVLIVDPTATGVTVEPGLGTDLEPLSTLRLDGVVVGAEAVLGRPGEGDDVVATVTSLGIVGICARQAGTCDAALRTAATYTSEREQFGTKIATFQAVAHRLADAYIDTEAIRLTAIHAAWLLDEGLPADEALGVAKVWATEGAQRVVHGAQHVHGGIGVDTDYPLHRWFRAAKAAEHTLGTAHPHLVALGARVVGAA